jgi:hypothetical protein
MDFISLTNTYIKIDQLNPDIFDLFTSTFVYKSGINLSEYITERDVEMRLDLIFQRIYNLDDNEVGLYLGDMDVILYINGIDNPLNIREGIVIKYPTNMGDIEKFRVVNVDDDLNNKSKIKDRLSFPNKSTRKDKSREEFIKGGYSLPPVVLETPKPPVSIKDGKFSIGGL